MKKYSILAIISCLLVLATASPTLRAEEKPESKPITSADLIGKWKVKTISGDAKHPMVNGTIELTKDGRMISTYASGKNARGLDESIITHWYLLRTEAGRTILAHESTNILSDPDPILDRLEVPLVVTLKGKSMTWSPLIKKDPSQKAQPSDIILYELIRM